MTQTRFLSLVGPMQARMFRLAYSFLREREEARDAVQDVLVKLWEKRDELQKVQSAEAWCIRITKNAILDRLKYNGYRRTSDLGRSVENINVMDTETAAESKDRLHTIRKIIDRLPERQRLFIHLRDVEGLAYNEIASIMELSLAEVKVGLFRARQAIRENLKNLESYGL